MYDYYNNGNQKQVKETVPTWSQLWFFSTVPHFQSPSYSLMEKRGSDQAAS